MDTAEVVTKLWTACDARDWPTFGGVLADDVVYEVPQTRERVRGRDAYVRFCAEFPGEWHLAIVRVVGDEAAAASWLRFLIDGVEMPGLTFFEFDDDGLISRIADFWPEPYDPPPGREHLVERY